MNKLHIRLRAIVPAILLGFIPSRAQDTLVDLSLSRISPLTGIAADARGVFRGSNLALQAVAVGLAPVIVQSGLDRETHNEIARHSEWAPYGLPAVGAATLLPVGLSVGLYAYGRAQDAPREVYAGCAVAQSAILAFLEQSILKAATGRPGPKPREMSQSEVETFRFGFMRGGIFWGWPSGHMLNTAAVLSTLPALYPDNSWMRWGCWTGIAATFASVMVVNRSSMHFLSDATSGTLMGLSIGSSVGAGFARSLGMADSARFRIEPVVGAATGAQARWTF